MKSEEIEVKVGEMLLLLGNDNEHLREAGRKTLYDYHRDPELKPVVIESVISALQSRNAFTRENAALLLGNWEIAGAIPALVAVHDDADAKVKEAVRSSLAQISEAPERVNQHKELLAPVFIKFLEEKRDESDARAFVKTLGYFKAAEAVPILADWLERSPGFSTFSNVATIEFELRHALVNIGAPSIPPLVKILESGNDAQMAQAAQVLGELKAVEAIPGLVKALDHSFYGCSSAAKKALQQIGKPAVPEMLNAFESSSKEYLKAHAEYWKDPHFSKSNDELAKLRERTDMLAELLGKQKAVDAVPAMLGLVKAGAHTDSIIIALGRMKDRRATLPLIGLIPEVHGPSKGTLFRSLGEIGDERACEPLISQFEFSSMSEKDKSIREALVLIGEKAIPYLKANGPKGTDLLYRMDTIEQMKLALVQIKGGYTMPELLDMLGKARETELRGAIFDGIVAHGSSAVIPLLNKAVFERKISPEDCQTLIDRIDKAAKLETGVVAKVEKPAGMDRAALPVKA